MVIREVVQQVEPGVVVSGDGSESGGDGGLESEEMVVQEVEEIVVQEVEIDMAASSVL